ncbi:MAG: hypothetical protein JXN61_17625 [Sedimentisphaerales bacterium]|nr:hypothetical protein [Sedimentisphaerales bacterium]
MENQIKEACPEYEVYHSGKLTTPDIVVRSREHKVLVGLEIKKLIQTSRGKDPRGMTIDYNSCLPCGRALIKIGEDTVEIPCFYLFALLDPTSTEMLTSIIMDGDFLNYDFELHKDAKYANQSEYNHGPYGEGSVRHRRMYTYPNPLNYKMEFFYLRHILVIKKQDTCHVGGQHICTDLIVRDDKYDNSFHYVVIDNRAKESLAFEQLPVRKDIFRDCKNRRPRERRASMPHIPVAE